jgi:hypothetical protein
MIPPTLTFPLLEAVSESQAKRERQSGSLPAGRQAKL